MIFRTIIHDGGATVTVEEDGDILLSVAVADRSAATALVKKAVKHGVDAIRPKGPQVEPDVARKKKVK